MASCGLGQGDYSAPAAPMPAGPGPDGEECDDCVQVVKTTKKVRVPCHRNEYKQYTVKVPRQVTETVPREVKWTDYETRSKSVAYKAFRQEERIKFEEQKYQVPVSKTITKMVPVTRKIPKTIYIDVTSQVPKQETITNMEERTRQVKIPYTVTVPETKYRTENYQVPVQKSKTVMDKVVKTVFDTHVRTRCEPKVTYVTKEIPVYNVIARPAQPCPPEPCYNNQGAGGGQVGDGQVGGGQVGGGLMAEFNALDVNKDGGISAAEYARARAPAMMHGGYNQAQASVSGSVRQSLEPQGAPAMAAQPMAPQPAMAGGYGQAESSEATR